MSCAIMILVLGFGFFPGVMNERSFSAAERPVSEEWGQTVQDINAVVAQLQELNQVNASLTEQEKELEARSLGRLEALAGQAGTPAAAEEAGILKIAQAMDTEAMPEPERPAATDSMTAAPIVVTPEKVGYWDTDIRQQTIEEIRQHQILDATFEEMKNIVPEQAKPREENPEAVPPVQVPVEILRGLIQPEFLNKTMDLDFDETSLSDVVLLVGSAAQINVVLDPTLKNNKLDLHLKAVRVEEVLLLLAQSHDLGFKAVGDSLYITKEDKLRAQNIVSRVVRLKNIKASEVKAMIKDMVSTINLSDEINSLTIVGQPEDIITVEKIISKIDRPQPQVVLEAKIIEANKDALKDLGVDWSDQINLQYQESGRPVDFANVEDAPASPIEIMSMARNPLQFSSIIRMLENQNKVKVLSNPRVTTLNDKEAEIFVGDRIPYTVTSITGGVATTDVRFEEPGIRLKITPSIIEDDFVVIKVEPEVSFIFAFRGPDDQYPWIKKRHATAYVRVKNNQPFVLGGLLNEEDKRNLYKVPFLGNVPLLGNLFTYEKQTVLDTELIITITPTIVYDNP